MINTYLAALLAYCLLYSPQGWSVNMGETYDVLKLPAQASHMAARAQLFSIARAGDRMVVVGQRGFILYSDDFGDSWQQAEVPVRSTLLCVYFPTPQQGWATGHDGVVLHSSDGGETWFKQLDGYQAVDIGLAHYRKLAKNNPDKANYGTLIGEFEFAESQGADRPFFLTWFEDDKVGWVIGAYGMAMRTFDGGATWVPVLENSANLDFMHVFDYEVVGDTRYLSGEAGLIWVQTQRLTKLEAIVPFYDGSLYTIISSDNGELIVAGLRSTAFRSSDGGENWTPLALPSSASIVGSCRLQDGRMVLVSQGGDVLVSNDNGVSFEPVAVADPYPFSDVKEGRPGELILAGKRGVRRLRLD